MCPPKGVVTHRLRTPALEGSKLAATFPALLQELRERNYVSLCLHWGNLSFFLFFSSICENFCVQWIFSMWR